MNVPLFKYIEVLEAVFKGYKTHKDACIPSEKDFTTE